MKKIIVRGNLEYIKPKEPFFSGVKWVEDTKGKYERTMIVYNWYERILIRLGLLKDKSYHGKFYIISCDPIKERF